jgi:hypothetical protein
MEQTHELLNAILMAHIKSNTDGELPPSMLNYIGKFTEYDVCFMRTRKHHSLAVRTLHKIYAFVEAQHNGNRVKQFFRQGEITTLLKDCKAGLQQGLDMFQVGHLVSIQKW